MIQEADLLLMLEEEPVWPQLLFDTWIPSVTCWSTTADHLASVLVPTTAPELFPILYEYKLVNHFYPKYFSLGGIKMKDFNNIVE